MDTKRLILAIALSIIIITLYQALFVPKKDARPPVTVKGTELQQPSDQTATTDTAKSDPGQLDINKIIGKPKKEPTPTQELAQPVSEDIQGDTDKEIVIETDLFTVKFMNRGAGLNSLVLKNYLDDTKAPLELVSERVKDFSQYPFYFSPFSGEPIYNEINQKRFAYDGELSLRLSGNNSHEILFEYKDSEQNLSVVKRFTIRNGSYVIGIDLQIIKDGESLDCPIIFGPDLENNISKDRVMQQGLRILASDGSKVNKVDFRKIRTEPTSDPNFEMYEGPINGFFHWTAYSTTYFTAMFNTNMKKADIKYYLLRRKLEENLVSNYSYIIVSNPTHVFLGPKHEDILSDITDVFVDANDAIQYGMFGSIAKIMGNGINFIFKYIPNYGWSIIIFTLFLKILLFPLTYTSSVSMAKMQTLQPKIKAIKKKYKNVKDPEQRRKMNVETMALYKQEKVNPAGGCLPMLLQLPILFGFFRLLAVSINVRHEPWMLWIKDLSLKDPIFLLPILMGATQILLQKMSPTSADSSQKKMMYIMPVVIVFFVINLPSGLTLYWFISNLLQIGQQHFINKKIFKKKKEEDRMSRVQKRKKGAKVKK